MGCVGDEFRKGNGRGAQGVLMKKNKQPVAATNSGMTLVEVMIALSVAAIGMLGFSQAIIAAVALNEANQEEALARAGAQEFLESCQGVTFDEVFARFNLNDLDDPAAGPIFGGSFAVEGLQAQDGDPDGMVGEVQFPTIFLVDNREVLREDVVDAELGSPQDLNGDNVIDDLDHSEDYLLLPIRVSVSWRGRAGPSQIEFRTILSGL